MDRFLNFQIFKTEANNFEVSKDNSYAKTYQEFIKYFENIKIIEEHHLIISSHFIYGWMPTIINLNLQETEKTLRLLNKAKSGIDLNIQEFDYLIVTINNSMVGLSKLLHFIKPDKYAIWDSRIFRFVTGKKSQYGISNPRNYLEYLSIIKSISQDKYYPLLHRKIENSFKYDLFPTRAIEVVIFEADKKRQKNLKSK